MWKSWLHLLLHEMLDTCLVTHYIWHSSECLVRRAHLSAALEECSMYFNKDLVEDLGEMAPKSDVSKYQFIPGNALQIHL